MTRTTDRAADDTGRAGGSRPASLPAGELDRLSAGTVKLGTASSTFFTILR